MRKITFLIFVFSGFLISCLSQEPHTYPAITSTDVSPIVLTQLAKPISTSAVNDISREVYDFTPSPTAIPDLERRTAEEITIYSAFLKEACKTPTLVLDEVFYYEGVNDIDLLQKEPSLSVQTLEDYRRNHNKKFLPSEMLPENSLCKFISSDEAAAQIASWDSKYKLLRFSTIGFNEKFDQAVIYTGYYCGKLCAGENLYILFRNNNVWSIKNWIPLWVS